MAVDEVLLEWAAQSGGGWWRFYQWAQPTLSLGYFQEYARRAGHAASRGIACTRRLTGGGAIVHDRELTYSLAVPAGHRLALVRDRLYALVHQSLIATLADWSVAAALYPAAAGPATTAPLAEPFLCFERRAAGDVVVGPAKIAGSPNGVAGGPWCNTAAFCLGSRRPPRSCRAWRSRRPAHRAVGIDRGLDGAADGRPGPVVLHRASWRPRNDNRWSPWPKTAMRPTPGSATAGGERSRRHGSFGRLAFDSPRRNW